MTRVFSYALAVPLALGCASNEGKLGVDNKPAQPRPDPQEQDAAADVGAGRAADWVGDGTLGSVRLVEIYDAATDFFCSPAGCRPGLAVDLEFNPARPGELWVVYRQPYTAEVCNSTDPASLGCQLLSSSVAIISGADTDSPSVELKEDGNAWHFMRVATALAFGDDDTFATVGEARTGNYMDAAADYMGPTWWSSDPAIFAQEFERNGSHLDMLHATPFGMGIAHDPTLGPAGRTEPVYWAFNGQLGSVDRYDFKLPHEPGGEDHSDGTYVRYVAGELQRVPNVPSHLEFGDLRRAGSAAAKPGTEPDWRLYIADSGHQRVVRLDPLSGEEPVAITTQDSQIAAPLEVRGAQLEEVVAPGVVALPSGLAVADDLLFVGDAETSRIHVFDLDGKSLEVLDTELPPGSLAGLAVGPDQRLYFADWNEGRVLRIEPR